MVNNDMIKGTIGVAVAFILLASLVIPSYADTQGDLESGLQSITTTENWESVVNTSASTDYNITNDKVVLAGDTGNLQTETYSTDSTYDTFEVNVSNLAADTDVTLYDDTGTQLDTVTASGDTTVTLSVTDYSADGYYLNFAAATATDAEVDSYDATGFNPVDSDIQILIFVALVLFLVGLGLSFYGRMN